MPRVTSAGRVVVLCFCRSRAVLARCSWVRGRVCVCMCPCIASIFVSTPWGCACLMLTCMCACYSIEQCAGGSGGGGSWGGGNRGLQRDVLRNPCNPPPPLQQILPNSKQFVLLALLLGCCWIAMCLLQLNTNSFFVVLLVNLLPAVLGVVCDLLDCLLLPILL